MKPLRVLLVTGSYPPMQCGVGDYTASLARALEASGAAQVSVLTSQGARAASDSRVEVRPLLAHWGPGTARQAIAAVRAIAPDLVHIQFPTQNYRRGLGVIAMATYLRRYLRLPLVITLHGHIFQSVRALALASSAHELITVFPDFVDRLRPLARRILARTPITVIGSGSPLPAVVLSDAERAQAREELGARPGERLVVYFGFLAPHRGVDLLFQIADPLRDRLAFVGALHPGYEAYASQLQADCGGRWEGRARMVGFLEPPQAARILAAADAVVLPLRNGGGEWNTSALSAVQQGTFTILTSLNPRGYDESLNVYWAGVDDVPAMRAALDQFAGRRHASPRSFSWDDIARRHAELYDRVFEKHRPA